jgi:predicted phosphatase
VQARSDHKSAKKQKNEAAKQLLLHIDKLNSGDLTKNQFTALTSPLSKEHKELTKISASKYKVLNQAKKDAKVLGFLNLNVFAFQFGIFSILFIFSIIFYILGRPEKYKTLVNSHKRFSILFMSISLYYLVWTFYPYSDLPRQFHLAAMFLIGFILSVAVMSLIDWKFEKKAIIQLYKDNFKILFRFIAITAKDYVDPSKATPYKKKYITEVVDNFKLPEE